MAQHKKRLTPFARFLLAIVIIVPLAYMGASYINGEDGVQNVKEMVGLEEKSVRTTDDQVVHDTANKTEEVAQKLKEKIEHLEETIGELEEENSRLEEIIKKRDEEIESLQK